MQQQINELQHCFFSELEKAQSTQNIEDLRVKYLGKKGPIVALMQSLKELSSELKPIFGKSINDLKENIAYHLDQQKIVFEQKEVNEKILSSAIDVTLPGRRKAKPALHPVTKMIDDLLQILCEMGFSIQYSPEIESEYHNYGGLNYPEDHPARDMQDTYYLDKNTLLRSHTTSIQQRIMASHKPPIRIAAPGKCYRNETISTRSHVIFHQIDVLYIDKNVTFSDLLATKKEFFSRIMEQEVELRVRPSYFPFVEPGMEVDIRCTECKGSGCRLCKHTGWLEVSGAGMVHPNVLKEGGIDPNVYSGFAWGGGVERLIMLKHKISDIRLFMQNDMRFLSQFL